MNGANDPSQHVYWLAGRSLGVVALAVVSLSVGLGLAMSGRIVRLPGAPARLKHLHEALSLTGLAAIAGHGLALLADRYLHPGLTGIMLPFALSSQPAWTGVGILAGWLAAIVGLSFYARRVIGSQVWRWLHRWTLAVYVMSVAHAIGSGSDGRSAWLLALIGLTATPAVFAGVYRFLPRERRPLPAGANP